MNSFVKFGGNIIMWVSIITSFACFAVSVLMFTKALRKFPYYQSISFYFLFEGIWELSNGMILQIWPAIHFMDWIHCIGITIFASYIVYSIYLQEFKNVYKNDNFD